MNNYHKSVLLREVINALNVRNGQKYIDATLGGGGHTSSIIEKGGIVLGIDADEEAIEFVSKTLELRIKNHELRLARGNFAEIDQIAKESGFEKVSGILFDLGVSSHQLDKPERGFSYLNLGPLDMRMDQRLGVKASDLVNALGKNELYEIFIKLGDEHRARAISESIISTRRVKPFETTNDLVEILASSYGFNNISEFAKATSSKKVFQALRIAVNDELGSLKAALPKALELIDAKGRIVVITFHSLEDRIVKRKFLEFENSGKGKVVTKKPVLPSNLEIEQNSRSKAAKLRIFEKK
ncbi:MAG: 16S rRNA (cytosine(1402)-N(4))-methyltransferase RsmH [Patescibacteria group bacterium]